MISSLEREPRSRFVSWLLPDEPRWMTILRASIYAAVLLVGFAFIRLDHSAPSWDQSHYLDMTYRFDAGLLSGGLVTFIHLLLNIDPGRAPLFSVALMPLTAVLGSSNRTGQLLNLLLWPVLLYSVHGIAAELFNRRAALLAMALTATIPILVGLSHEVLQDFLVVTLTTLTVLLILRTHFFERRGTSLALGVVLGLDALSKVTAVAYVAAPLIIGLVWAGRLMVSEFRGGDRRQSLSRLVNVMMATGLGAAILLSWYLPNLGPTLDYLHVSTSGQGVAGNAPPDYLSLRALLAFALRVVNSHLGWLIVLAGLIALVMTVPMKVRDLIRGRVGDRSHELFRILLLGSWIAVPFLAVGLSNNQDVRYMASSMPGVGVAAAGLLVAIRGAWIRRVMIVLASSLCVLQSLFIVLALPSVPALGRAITVPTPVGDAVLDFSGAGMVYEKRPVPQGSNYPVPIMEYLEARTRSSGGIARTIGLPETRPYVNGNTLGYFSDARGDRFTFVDIFAQPPEDLQKTLLKYDFILYVPPPAGEDYHIAVVNSSFAAGEITAPMLAMFTHSAWFPAGPGEQVEVLDRLP